MNSEIKRQLYTESLNTISAQREYAGPLGQFIGVVTAFIVGIQLEAVDENVYALPILMLAAFFGEYLVLAKHVKLRVRDAYLNKQWEMRFACINLLIGSLWAILLSQVPLDRPEVGYACIMIIGILINYTGIQSGLNTILTFCYLFPLITYSAFLYSKTNIFYEYAGVIISSILSAAGLVFTIRKNFKQNFMLRYEKNDLIALLQEQKRQADEANLAKTKFLAAASHDLRQPLQSTTLLLSALARYLTEEKQLGILSKARSSLNSLSELLNSLLDISKLDAGLIQVQPSNFNLNTLIHEEVGKYNDLAKHKGLCINVKLNSPISVCSDPVLLRRIMSNLLENAIRYSSAGTIQIMAASLDGNLVIEIQDQGVGIDPQYHETIFKEFYQIENPERDRKKGLGLGLAIVNRLVGLLGGSIHLESEVGQGSTFSIRFGKITLKEEVFRDLNPKNEPHPLPVLRVLVIDDEIQVRESMGILLESWGCEALLAGDLNGALSLLEPNPNIDIMIVDYRLRNHQTGTQCIEKIYKELGHPIPAIIITGDTEEAIIRELEMSGHPFLHKPIDDLSLHQYLLALSDQ